MFLVVVVPYTTVCLTVSRVSLQAVEEDFVAMRRTDTNMTADKFHQLLCLAR